MEWGAIALSKQGWDLSKVRQRVVSTQCHQGNGSKCEK